MIEPSPQSAAPLTAATSDLGASTPSGPAAPPDLGSNPPFGRAAPSDLAAPSGRAAPSDLVAATRALTRLSRVVEAASDRLTGADYRVLAMIAGGEARAARLADRLRLGKPAISSSVDSLSKRGLIVKRTVDGDNRAVALELSDTGVALFALMEARMSRQLELLVARTPEPAQTLAALASLGEVLDASMRAHSGAADSTGTASMATASTASASASTASASTATASTHTHPTPAHSTRTTPTGTP